MNLEELMREVLCKPFRCFLVKDEGNRILLNVEDSCPILMLCGQPPFGLSSIQREWKVLDYSVNPFATNRGLVLITVDTGQ